MAPPRAGRLLFPVLLLVSALAPTASATCSQTDTLSLQLPRAIQPEFAGFVVPTSDFASGAPKFSDECLQVKVQGGGMGFDSLQELKDGRADLAIAEGAYVAQKIQAGESLTIVAGFYQRNGSIWMGLQNFPTLKDLAFKKIGTWCCGYDLPFKAAIAQSTVSVPTTFVAQNTISLHQLASGEVDLATAMIYDELARPLQELNSSTNFLRQRSEIFVLDPASYGITSVHNVLVVKSSALAGERAKIVRFLRVVIKTWLFCRENEITCAAAFSEYGVPTPHHMWQMREVNKFIFPSPSGHGLGVLSLQRWNAMNTWLVASGALTTSVGSAMIDNTLALDAGALDDIATWTPFTEGSLSFCATYGSKEYRLCNGNEHTLCPAGQEPDSQYACKSCEPGRFAPKSQRMNTCQVCPSGRYSRGYGMSECELCEAGRFWAATASTNASVTECARCPRGRFANEDGASSCRPCEAGTLSDVEGATECKRCPFGRYVSAIGKSVCSKCKEGMATPYLGALSQSDCVCPQDTYLGVNGAACVGCPTGMICPVNSKESVLRALSINPTAMVNGQHPRLAPGYWSTGADPFSIYLCKDDKACPGGLPGRCGPNMKGLACGQCEAGYYREGLDCLKCTGTDESAFNYPILQIIIGPVIVFLMYWVMRDQRENWGSWWNELCNVAFTFFTHYQIVGLLVFTWIKWPSTLSSILMPWTYLVDLLNMLRLSCSSSPDFRTLLIVKVTAPCLLLAIFLLTYCVCFVIGKCLAIFKTSKDDEVMEPQIGVGQKLLELCPLEGNVLFNLYFAVFHTFYVSICFISLQLFMCYEHPTSDWSLLFAPEVICYSSDEWSGMITESIFALVAYIVAPIVGFTYVVCLAPKQFHKKGFHTRWKFLFIKFRPDTFWWMVFHMLRTLALCLMLVFSQEGSRQVYYAFVLLLFYAALLAIFFPWRHRSANLFDLLITCLLLYFCAISGSFSRRQQWLDDSLASFATAVSFMPIALLVLLLGWVSWSKCVPSALKAAKAKKLEIVADCKMVFTKLVSLDKAPCQAFVERLSAQDRDVLRVACATIVAELLGSQPGHTGLCWRLVHKEHQAGARTWHPTSATPAQEVAGGTR